MTLLLTQNVMAQSQSDPNKPIRMVVGFAPGGSADISARFFAEAMTRELKETVVVENKGGAGGNIAAAEVARAEPDGYTIFYATSAIVLGPLLYQSVKYDPFVDFSPVMLTATNPLVFLTAPSLAPRSLKEFVAYAKANPAKLNYGSGGNGSAGHLAGELFKSKAGIFAVHIPYNGGNPAQMALLSGQVDFNFDNLATASPNIKSGKLIALAVTTPQRSAVLPNVPAVSEILKDFSVDTWWGLVAPANTPTAIIEKLNQAFVLALQSAESKIKFATLMAEPVPSSPQEFGNFMKSELAKYESVVKASGARVD